MKIDHIILSIYFFVFVLVLGVIQLTSADQFVNKQEREDGCIPELIQDKCAFIVASGRSGSTALMNALNQVDSIFLRGENKGLNLQLESLYNHLYMISNHRIQNLDEKSLYHMFSQFRKPSDFNAFPINTADCMVKYIFKLLYGQGRYAPYTVGFKEIRFREIDPPVKYYTLQFHKDWGTGGQGETFLQQTRTYKGFRLRVEFLKRLCDNPKIILNYRDNITAASQSGFWMAWFAGDSEDVIMKMNSWMEEYHAEFPDSFVVHYKDMFDKKVNETLAYDLQKFLGVKYPQEITFANTVRDYSKPWLKHLNITASENNSSKVDSNS
eukprot:TRINITY_DN2528_c0_g1_i3.p1 TRINITY_DN2528_c0_g1~~TRINITY_DN2528_c0_g1_i3.p1  ORF type:complete len:325 (-),score=30.45 TRINITY_DN2528_c0_g1_i3:737-1711(-)